MQAEVEVRFLNVDHDALRKVLVAVGATCEHPMQLMKRAIIDYPDNRMRHGQTDKWSWIRVRNEGDKTLLTYKQVAKSDTRDTHEIECTVTSYDNAVAFFEAIGLKNHSEQQTRRETWSINRCLVTLDEWPWLAPMIELEGPDLSVLEATASRLGLKWEEANHGNVDQAYRLAYPGMKETESVGDLPELTFDTMPAWLKERQHAKA